MAASEQTLFFGVKDINVAGEAFLAHTARSEGPMTPHHCACGNWARERTIDGMSPEVQHQRHQLAAVLKALVSSGWMSSGMIKADKMAKQAKAEDLSDEEQPEPRRERGARTEPRFVFRDSYAAIKDMVVEALAAKHPEPPDGTRIEFQEHGSPGGDLIAIYRDDTSSAEAGWPTGDGGKVWCEYGRSVPITWTEVLEDPRLAAAIGGRHLIVKPEPKRVRRVFAAPSTQQQIPNDVDAVRDKGQKIWIRVKGASGISHPSDPWRVPGSFTYPYVAQAKLLQDYGPVTEVLS